MYRTTIVCLRNANSTRSRMAGWCHALSLVQWLPSMNTASQKWCDLLKRLTVFIAGKRCTAKDSAWHHAAIRLLVEFAFRRQTTVVGYILIFFFNIFLQRVHSFRIGKMNTDRLIMPQNVCIVQIYIRMSTMKPK